MIRILQFILLSIIAQTFAIASQATGLLPPDLPNLDNLFQPYWIEPEQTETTNYTYDSNALLSKQNNNPIRHSADQNPQNPNQHLTTQGTPSPHLSFLAELVAANISPKKFDVGPYDQMRGQVPGLDAHHVGQKAVMKDFIPDYNPSTAPTILVPKVGHTIRGPNGIVSRSTKGFESARDVVARDILELKRVYPDVPNAKLQELIRINKDMYPQVRNK